MKLPGLVGDIRYRIWFQNASLVEAVLEAFFSSLKKSDCFIDRTRYRVEVVCCDDFCKPVFA